MHIQKHYIRFNIFIIRALTNDILLSSFAGFSLLRRICCTRIIVSFGIPDNDSVVWFINIGCLLDALFWGQTTEFLEITLKQKTSVFVLLCPGTETDQAEKSCEHSVLRCRGRLDYRRCQFLESRGKKYKLHDTYQLYKCVLSSFQEASH